MTYVATVWEDEVPTTSPVLYNIKDSLGNILQANVQLEVASAITPGTPLNAVNLNHIEQGIANVPLSDVPAKFTAIGQMIIGAGLATDSVLNPNANPSSFKCRSGVPTWEQLVGALLSFSNTTCAAQTNTILTGSTASYLNGVTHDTATGKITIVTAGLYLVGASGFWTSSGAVSGVICNTSVYKNNAASPATQSTATINAVNIYQNAMALLQLSASDYLQLNAYWGYSGGSNVFANPALWAIRID